MKSVPYRCTVRHHDAEDLNAYAAVINAGPSPCGKIFKEGKWITVFEYDAYDDLVKEKAERQEDAKARKRLKVVRSMMPKLPLARTWGLQRMGGKEQRV